MRVDLLYLPPSRWPALLGAAAVSICPAAGATCAHASAQGHAASPVSGTPGADHRAAAMDALVAGKNPSGSLTALGAGPGMGAMPAAIAARFRAFSAATAALVWQAPFSVISNGVVMHIREFKSESPLGEVVQQLAHDIEAFQHMLTAPALIRLSGMADGGHWLAELQAAGVGSPGVIGRVSFMGQIAPSLAQAGNGGLYGDTGLLDWLPQGAERIFAHVEPGSQTGIRHAYRVGMQADALAVCIARRLAAQGWKSAQQAPQLQRLQTWRRGDNRLLVYLRGNADGTALYVHID